MPYNGTCPICEENLKIKEDVQISEIISCPKCNSFLVVDSVEERTLCLKQAPEIEEDWGE